MKNCNKLYSILLAVASKNNFNFVELKVRVICVTNLMLKIM